MIRDHNFVDNVGVLEIAPGNSSRVLDDIGISKAVKIKIQAVIIGCKGVIEIYTTL